MMSVNTITLHQPWASLFKNKPWMKHVETRSWQAPSSAVGKPLAIHAGKTPVDWLAVAPTIEPALERAGLDPDHLPMSAIVAVGILQCCVRVPSGAAHVVYTREHPLGLSIPPPEPERSYGDYTPGRFAWVLTRIHTLRRPISYRGEQGLWQCYAPALMDFAWQLSEEWEASRPKQEALF